MPFADRQPEWNRATSGAENDQYAVAPIEQARNLMRRGILAAGDFNALLAADHRIHEGSASADDQELVRRWIDRADSDVRRNEAVTALERRFAETFGSEVYMEAEQETRALAMTLYLQILETASSGASAQQLLGDWREFSRAVQRRSTSENARKPQLTIEALRNATRFLDQGM
jgi:hypothetical protein